jgi:Yip1 domain
MNPMNLVTRVINILVQPRTEWPAIVDERTNPATLYLGYVAILAALPAVAGFVSTALVGTLASGRLGAGVALSAALTSYVLSLGMVFLMAVIADALASRFGGRGALDQALKLVAYSLTPSWVAGLFTFLPVVAWLITLLAGLYSLYLFHLGAPLLMKVPEREATGYTVALFAIAIVIAFLIGTLIAAMFGMGAIGMMGAIGRF